MIEQLRRALPLGLTHGFQDPGLGHTVQIAIVNGMGGCTMMELLTVYRELALALDAQGIPHRAPMVGSYSTTQEMAGFSISLLTPTPQMLELWLAPQDAPQFPVLHGGGA